VQAIGKIGKDFEQLCVSLGDSAKVVAE